MPGHRPPDDRSRGGIPPWPIDPDLDPNDPAEPAVDHRRRTTPAHRLQPAVLAAIAAGGVLGAESRYLVERAWPAGDGFPAATLVVNTSGAFALGLLLTVLLRRRPGGLLRPFACVGFLGAWTTMSTLAVDTVSLFHAGRAGLAAGYLAATVAAGLAAAVAGTAVGRLLAARTLSAAEPAS